MAISTNLIQAPLPINKETKLSSVSSKSISKRVATPGQSRFSKPKNLFEGMYLQFPVVLGLSSNLSMIPRRL